MSNLQPPNTSLRRLTLCGLTAVLFLSSALFPAYAQVETVFGTGYCIEDTDGDGRFDFDELGSAFPESEIAAPSAVGSSFDGNEQTISITRREVNSDGTTDNTIFSEPIRFFTKTLHLISILPCRLLTLMPTVQPMAN